MVSNEPTFTIISEHGHVKVGWPDPPRPTYEVAHEVIAEIAEWRNAYADMVERGGKLARMGCPKCRLDQRHNLPAVRCVCCGAGFYEDGGAA